MSGIEQWDLTHRVSPYLDRHMVFPLLEYLDTLIEAGAVNYKATDIAAARLALLKPTHMVDYVIDVYKSVEGQAPPEMEHERVKVLQTLADLKQGCAALDKICQDKDERVSRSAYCGRVSTACSAD